MRLAKIAAILVVSICPHIFAQPLRAIDRSEDRTQILSAIEAISKGYVGRDPYPFEYFYLDNYLSIKEKPVFNGRDQLIAMMKADAVLLGAGKKLDYETLQYETESPQIRFLGLAAIVTSTKRNLWQYKGQKCLTKMATTELWVKPDGDWKLAAGHGTTFQCDNKPFHPIHPAVAKTPPRTKPANTDTDTEQLIRSLLTEVSLAQSGRIENAATVLKSGVSADFKGLDANGESSTDRSILADLPLAVSRSVGMRDPNDILMIFPGAAVYSFKIKAAAVQPSAPKQCSIFLARQDGRWQIAAFHISKYIVD